MLLSVHLNMRIYAYIDNLKKQKQGVVGSVVSSMFLS